MITTTRTIKCFVLILWCSNAISASDKVGRNRSVEEFVRQFTSLLSHHALSYREKDLQTDYLNVINQQFGNQENFQPITDGAYPPRPPPFRPRPESPEYERPLQPGYGLVDGAFVPGVRPGRPPRPTRPIPPGFLPERPALPPGYRPPPGSYPQTSLFEALYSIAKYDDLRCVPRLLCEVTSGSNVTKSKKDDKSPVPFLTKDAFITLLTVLNFVDDSPILLFVRAAFLGYSSKGDTKACLNAYPTCPRDPDQLVNYLNNHNGGFFRFFNQQLRQQPSYRPFVQKLKNDTNGPPPHQQDNGVEDDYDYDDHNNNNNNNNDPATPPNHRYGFAPRILNDPIEIDAVNNYHYETTTTKVIANWPNVGDKRRIVFVHQFGAAGRPEQPEGGAAQEGGEHHSPPPTRRGKKISFPDRPSSSAAASSSPSFMIFPDRTGTGNLILSGDSNGNYKIVFDGDQQPVGYPDRKSRIKFLSDNDKYETKMRFPQEE